MTSRLLKTCTAIALAFGLAFAPAGPADALSVFDKANYRQNLTTATRTLTMINNQIRQLANEAEMLVNMAKQLERLDFSSAAQIQTSLYRIQALMRRAEGITFEVSRIEETYARLYPTEYTAAVTRDDMVRHARERWRRSRQAFQHTMLVQGQVVTNVAADAELLHTLMAESQAAVGSLQAQQAGNQLVAFTAKQQLQTQELLAAQFRAEALERARHVMAEERARAEFERFIGDGRAYTPLD